MKRGHQFGARLRCCALVDANRGSARLALGLLESSRCAAWHVSHLPTSEPGQCQIHHLLACYTTNSPETRAALVSHTNGASSSSGELANWPVCRLVNLHSDRYHTFYLAYAKTLGPHTGNQRFNWRLNCLDKLKDTLGTRPPMRAAIICTKFMTLMKHSPTGCDIGFELRSQRRDRDETATMIFIHSWFGPVARQIRLLTFLVAQTPGQLVRLQYFSGNQSRVI